MTSSTPASDPDRHLLGLLASGALQSGEALARAMGVSRAAIWKRLAKLESLGVALDRLHGRGYRLAVPLELLDSREITAHLPSRDAGDLRVETVFSTDSTNRRLLDRDDFHGRILVAEYQRGGRGRRGRTWLSPLGSGLCLSLGWHYPSVPPRMTCLSILAGAAVLGALHELGASGVTLKWPNDLLVGGAKLGGLLIETRAQLGGTMDVVIGVGINVRLPGDLSLPDGYRAADLDACGVHGRVRNALAGRVAGHLVQMLAALERDEIDAYLEFWRRHDAGTGREAEIHHADAVIRGRVLGITETGLLRMATDAGTREFASGELSLRLGAP